MRTTRHGWDAIKSKMLDDWRPAWLGRLGVFLFFFCLKFMLATIVIQHRLLHPHQGTTEPNGQPGTSTEIVERMSKYSPMGSARAQALSGTLSFISLSQLLAFPADDSGEDAGRALSVIMVPKINDTMTAQVELGHLEFDADEIVRGLRPRFSRLLRS